MLKDSYTQLFLKRDTHALNDNDGVFCADEI
jgi:hypothetical protein